MTGLVGTVVCDVCFTTHLEVPPPREDGELHSEDWTYYRDWHEGMYAVICRRKHDALLAPKLSKMES